MDHRFGESGGKVKTEKVGSNDLNPLFSGKSLAQAASQDGIHFDQIEPSRYLSQSIRESTQTRTDLQHRILRPNPRSLNHLGNHGRIDEKVLAELFMRSDPQFAEGE